MTGATALRRSVVLKRRPSGEPGPEHFELREDAVPSPGPNEVVTRAVWLSIDPYMRGRLREQQTYAAGIAPGAGASLNADFRYEATAPAFPLTLTRLDLAGVRGEAHGALREGGPFRLNLRGPIAPASLDTLPVAPAVASEKN